MKNKLLLIFLAIAVSSCYTHRKLSKISDYKPALFDKSQLEGLYENAVPDDPNYSLWEDLYKHKSLKKIAFDPYRTQVELVVLSEKLVQANLYRSGMLEDSIQLKGKIKDGYFVVNRKFFLLPLPIFYFYKENKTILGNDIEGNLILTQGHQDYYVLFLTLTGGDSNSVSARYMKL